MASRTMHIRGGERVLDSRVEEAQCLPPQRDWVTDRWIYVHYPEGWSYDDDHDEWLPELSKLIGKPGVNGTRKDGGLGPQIGAAVEKGGVVIRPDDRRLGGHQHYVVRHKITGGGYHYAFHTEEFRRVGRSAAKSDASASASSWHDFRVIVRDKILTDGMDALVFNSAEDVQRRRIERTYRRAKGNADDPNYQAQIKRLKLMTAAYERAAKSDGEPISTGEPVSGIEGEIPVPKPRAKRRVKIDGR